MKVQRVLKGGVKMAILEKEVKIVMSSNRIKYYEDLGYNIPRYIDKKGRLAVKIGTEVLVKVDDLQPNSKEKLTKVCDICKREVSKKQDYGSILRSRKINEDGLDKCRECASREVGIQRGIANFESCVSTTHPEFAKLFWNVEDTYKYTYGSTKRINFKCPTCDHKIENKIISSVYSNGLFCPKCSDGLSYPEKFMYSVLEQLNLNFEYQKKFKEFDCKYDFYLETKKCIIETHGLQHYEKGNRGRTFEDEKKNDVLKERIAKESIGIISYLIIDCRYSTLQWIKNNILKSNLNILFDLSEINWLKCHEFACNSLVKKACELWNEGNKSTVKIGKKLKLNKNTVRRYLLQGTEAGWCDYDPKEVLKETGTILGKNSNKTVIQLTLEGKLVKEWKSIIQVEKELGIGNSNISSVCNGKQKSAGSFMWMYKEDYEKAFGKIKPYENKWIKKIVQLTLESEYIKDWDSIVEVTNNLGVHSGHITSVCKGKRKSSGGFKWMYKEDYDKYKSQNETVL
jgi:hypothetical protein